MLEPYSLVAGGSLALVGVLTSRAGWLGLRGRLRVRGHRLRNEAAFVAAARVAGPPLLAAGAVAVLGAAVAVLQPTPAATLTVWVIVFAGACGLALTARRLADRAAAPFCGRAVGCAGCPYRAPDRAVCEQGGAPPGT